MSATCLLLQPCSRALSLWRACRDFVCSLLPFSFFQVGLVVPLFVLICLCQNLCTGFGHAFSRFCLRLSAFVRFRSLSGFVRLCSVSCKRTGGHACLKSIAQRQPCSYCRRVVLFIHVDFPKTALAHVLVPLCAKLFGSMRLCWCRFFTGKFNLHRLRASRAAQIVCFAWASVMTNYETLKKTHDSATGVGITVWSICFDLPSFQLAK